MIHLIATVILMSYIIAVAVVDLRSHRIPNWLSLSAAVLGIALQMVGYAMPGLLQALGGLLVGFMLFLPFYVLRAFGAGDVKAMATVGIFFGPQHAALAVALTLIAGAVIGMFVLWRQSLSATEAWYRLLGTFLSPTALLRRTYGSAVIMESQESAEPSQSRVHKFPYGVAIAVGTVLTLWWTDRLFFLFGQLSN